MSSDNPFEDLQIVFDAQKVLSGLTPEELAITDKEGKWIQKQVAAGRTPSPEKLLEHAPLMMRLVARMDNLAERREQQ